MQVIDDRYNQWIQASQSLGRIEPFMVPVLQGLGRLDCQLISEDLRFRQLPQEARNTIHESLRLTDRFTLSYLWVLGAYELVRTLDQLCSGNIGLLEDELTQHVRGLKHMIERLRIPLAKFEPARRHPNDSPIAYPAISREFGVAWQLAPDTFVSRRELSDALLKLAEDISNHFPQDAYR
jgi:hypothetical protein